MRRRLKPPAFEIAAEPRHILFCFSLYDEMPERCPKCNFNDPTVIKDKNHAAAPVGLYCPLCDTQFKRIPSSF